MSGRAQRRGAGHPPSRWNASLRLYSQKKEKKTTSADESILLQQQGSGSTANRVGFVKRLFTSSSESDATNERGVSGGKKSPASVNKKNGDVKETPQQPLAPPVYSAKQTEEEDGVGKTEKNDEGKDREKESSVYEATMECRYYAPGQLVCALGSQGAAHFIECGVLEATFVKSNNVKNKNNSDVSWRAHPGDVVQPFALLANTRSSIELREVPVLWLRR